VGGVEVVGQSDDVLNKGDPKDNSTCPPGGDSHGSGSRACPLDGDPHGGGGDQ
jgi:hypothetical protein